jgi:phosphatidylglycerol lysyltransferase
VIGFERSSFVAAFLAAIALGSGTLTLISVIDGASEPRVLAAVFPLEFSRLSRSLTILIGFVLIASSLNIYRRKKRAWAIVLALSLSSIIFHLTREINHQETLLSSTLLFSLTASVYSGFALFRPMLYRFHMVPRERAMARGIVQHYARTPLDLFKLWPDKCYFFSPSQRCVIAYRVANNTAVALGDPVGPKAEIGATAREFVEMCRKNGWAVAFYQTLPDFLPVYRRLRLKRLKIGDDAMVDLPHFSLQGKSKRELRCKVRQLEAMGIHSREFQPPVPDDIIAQLKAVSDQWLRIPGRRERSFTVGQFDPDYLRSTPVLVVVDSVGTVLAFINLISVGRSEITGDLMRRRTDAPNGTMDYLFIKLFLYARERGYARVSLGMAPMTGFQKSEEATMEERAIHRLFQKLDFLFSFRGLYRYKAKFATSWEPRYLVYGNVLELPRTALALRRLSEIKKEKDQRA